MALIQSEAAETSRTVGMERPYTLQGPVLGNRPFRSVMNDGDECYYRAYDTVRHERGTALFIAPNLLFPINIYESTNKNNPVEWPARGQCIIKIEPAPPEYINAELSKIRESQKKDIDDVFERMKEWIRDPQNRP